MRHFQFNKLVRDKVAEQIKSQGGTPHVHHLSGNQVTDELKRKILEEAQELQFESADNLIGELADLQELIAALQQNCHISKKQLDRARQAKNDKAGIFEQQLFIDYVSVPDTDPWIDHFLSNADKYPEIKN